MAIYSRESMCGIKRQYARRRDARRAAQRVGTGVEPYKCFYCGSWHVGHPPERRR